MDRVWCFLVYNVLCYRNILVNWRYNESKYMELQLVGSYGLLASKRDMFRLFFTTLSKLPADTYDHWGINKAFNAQAG